MKMTATFLAVAMLSGCAVLQPTASPEDVTSYIEACKVKVNERVRTTPDPNSVFTADAERAAMQLRWELGMNDCVGPYLAEQNRRQTNINTQARADAVFAAAFLGGVAAAALTPRTVYVVPVRCGRWGCW